MKAISLILMSMMFTHTASADVTTSDRVSYIITLNLKLNEHQLDQCMVKICEFSGADQLMECEIVSRKFKIAAANLSHFGLKNTKALTCVKSLRIEQFNYEPRPRSGTSN